MEKKKVVRTIIVFIVAFILLALVGARLLSKSRYREVDFKPPSPPPYAAPKRDLTPREQKALNIPLHSATVEEKKEHATEVAELAKSALALDITGCKPDPLVYQVDLKGSFKIKNNDPIPHTVRYLSTQTVVPAHSTTTVKTSELFTTAGDYGYGCDNPFAKMGVFMVR